MTFPKHTSLMRGLNDISLLYLRVCVIHNKTKQLSIIKPSCCSSKNNQYLLFKQSNLGVLPQKGEVLFISNPSKSLLNNSAVDTVAGCAYCC